jgi:dolichyl-phosphooligosaccharide-protein glycotransferase
MSVPSTPSSGWWQRHGWTVAILLVAFGTAFALRTVWTYPLIAKFGPLFTYGGGSDSYYHSRVTTYIILTHTNLIHDPLLRFPLGSTNPREPLFDWSNAVLGLAFAPFFGGNAVVAGAWFLDLAGPFWAALEVFPIYLIGREISGKRMGLMAALIFPFLSASIDSSVFGYANYLSFYTFVILVVMYCYLRTVKAAGTRRWVTSYRNFKDVWQGLLGFLRTERTAVKWAVFTGVALGAMAMSWQGWTYMVVVIGVSLLVSMFVERVRHIDTFGLYVSAWIVGLVAFPMAFPYYFVQTEVTKLMGPAIVIYFGALLLLLPFLFLRDVPWVFSVPFLIAIVGGAVLGLGLIFPSYFTLLVTGQGYFVKNLVYSTIAEAQPPSFDALVLGYGVFTFFLAFVGLALVGYLVARQKFRRWHVVFLVYAIISVYLPTTATKFFLVATPAFALLAAEALHRALDVGRYPEFRRTVASLSDRGSQFAAFRKAFRPRHVLIMALVVVMILPNVWVAIDAGIPSSTKSQFADQINDTIPSWLKLNTSAPAANYLGAAGAGLDTSNQYDSAAYNWLATQDTSTPEADRPAFISWWDYGFQAIDQGQHPSVADNFQHGIDPAGQFLLAQNESLAIGVLVTTLLQAEQQVSHTPALPASLNTILAADGVNTTELHTLLTNEANDYALVVAHPEKYLPVNPSTVTDDNAMYLAVSYFLASTLPLSGVSKLYDDVQAYTGWSIRYAMVDTRIFPFSGTNTGIFYAPADLTGRVINDAGLPVTFFNVNETGSNGQTYPLGQAPGNVTAVNYTIDYKSPFFDSMIYRIYAGFNGTDVGQSGGVPGLSGAVGSDAAEPGWMLQHFEVVYRTAYACAGVKNATSGSSCFLPVNYPVAQAISKAKNGTADTSTGSYYGAGEAILAYFPGETLVGTVALGDGTPVGGVHVTVEDGWKIPHMVATTAPDGSFSVVLPPGNDSLVISAGNVTGVNQTGPKVVRTIAINVSAAMGYSLQPVSVATTYTVPSGTVEGVVFRALSNNTTYAASDPIVAGAKVTLAPTTGIGATLTAVTDASGGYVIPNVPPGGYTVHAAFAGATFSGTAVLVPGGTAPVNASVAVTTATISGPVADAKGTKYPGATVLLSNASGVVATALAGGTGAYTMTGVLPGTYTLRAVVNATLRSPGLTVFVKSSGGTMLENLTVAPAGTASIVIKDQGVGAPGVPVVFTPVLDLPVAGTSILAGLTSATTNTTLATTNGEGIATASLAPGTYSIYALGSAGGAQLVGLGTVAVSASGVPSSATIDLVPAVRLTGTLTGTTFTSSTKQAVVAASSTGAEAIAWAGTNGSFTFLLPSDNYTLLGASGPPTTISSTYAGLATIDLGPSTVATVPLTPSVPVRFAVGTPLAHGNFFPAIGANVTVSVGSVGPAFTETSSSNGSVGFFVPSSVPLASGGYCVSASAFGFGSAQECGLSPAALGNLTRLPMTLTPVPVLLTVTGLPANTPVTVNLTAESDTAVNRSYSGGPVFNFTLPPGEYGVGASAVITKYTHVYLPASILSTEIPVGATLSNLTLVLVPEINATGTLVLPPSLAASSVEIDLVAPGLDFHVNGSQYTNATTGFRVSPGPYTATVTGTVGGTTYVNVTHVTVNASGTVTPKLVLSQPGLTLQGNLEASNGATVAVNTTVTLVRSGGVTVVANATRGHFSATLPPGGTYSVYANATQATSGPNGTFNQTWSVVAGSTCTVAVGSTSCSVPMLGEVQLVTLRGVLLNSATTSLVPGTVRLVGPYPRTTATVVASANGSFSVGVVPGAYYLYASENGSAAATFARVVALPPHPTNVTLVLEPSWIDTITVGTASPGQTLGRANVTIVDAYGNRTVFSGLGPGSSIPVALPPGTYAVRGNASGTLNGVAGTAVGNATVRVASGNVGTALDLAVPVALTVSGTLAGPSSATVSAGGTATFSFSAKATGNRPVVVHPVGSPSFWTFSFSFASANLTPGGPSVSGEVSIHIPLGTAVEHAPVAISFDLANGTSVGNVTPAPVVTVLPYYGVSVTATPSAVAVGVTSVTVPFVVQNTGNALESVAVSVVNGNELSSLGWTVSLLESGKPVGANVSITAGTNESFTVNLTLAATAFVPPGSVTVSATVVTAGGGNTSTVTVRIPKATLETGSGSTIVTGPGVTTRTALPTWVVPLLAFVPAITLAIGVTAYRWWRTRRWRRR